MKEKRQRSIPLQVRVSADEITLFKHAAKHSGLTLSGWARARLLTAAREELAKTQR